MSNFDKEMRQMQPYPEKMSFFDRLQLYLFDEQSNIPEWHRFTPKELQMKKRYATIFSFWVDKPAMSDKAVVNFIMREFKIGRSRAYLDLSHVKILLGNVRNATKEWQRFKLISMLDKAYEIAEKTKDAKAMIMAADKLGKYTQLDKEDAVKIPYDEIVPQSFEITGDVRVLGIKPIKDLAEKQRKMREKYGGTNVEEAEMIDDQE